MTSGEWSADDVPDLTDRRAIVTGATSGVGLEAAWVLAMRGAEVILAVRNLAKGAEVEAEILMKKSTARVQVLRLDVSELASVRAFADAFRKRYDRLDILLNNAGVMMVPYGTTSDGFERHLATNHLGHFALTGLLIEPLRASERGRVVAVSSNAHRSGDIDFDNLMYPGGRNYTPIGAYSRSKLANLVGAYELDRRLRARGERLISVACHPGVTNTGLAGHLEKTWWGRVTFPVLRLVLQNAADGALPLLRAATDPDVVGGEYFGPSRRRETTGAPVRVGSSPLSRDESLAARLWEVCEGLTGVSYP